MTLIKQISFFLAFWFLGEVISHFLISSIPGSIIGMLLLVLALEFKIIKPKDVNHVANFLLNNMAMFFIPAGVGLMLYVDILKDEWIPISIAITGSAMLVLAVVGWMNNKK